jgi:hypothetical protein
MPRFINLVEQGDESVHVVNVEHIVQMMHVPGAGIATVTLSDGKSFRISQQEFYNTLTALGSETRAPGAGA